MNKELQDLFDEITTDGRAYEFAMDWLENPPPSCRLSLVRVAEAAKVRDKVLKLDGNAGMRNTPYGQLSDAVREYYQEKFKELQQQEMPQNTVYQRIIASVKMAPNEFLQAFKERRNRPPYSPRDKASLVIDAFKARIRSASTTPPTEETLARVFDWIMENAPEPAKDQGTQELYELLVESEDCRNHLWNDHTHIRRGMHVSNIGKILNIVLWALEKAGHLQTPDQEELEARWTRKQIRDAYSAAMTEIINRHTPKETEEPEMNEPTKAVAAEVTAPAFETKDFVFGADVKNMNESQLYQALSRIKGEIDHLADLNKDANSERIKSQIDRLKDAQKKVVALIDELPE